jgi:class 3 adenylate cyclase/TolB-like protein/cytochrome c-type biogenesis protein CcmH/NrfG
MLADVAGYTRLMERDEAGTHMRLREIRAQITDPAIARHHGRIVRSAGDDMLVEFASAVEALSAAVAIQREMEAANRDLAPDSRIEFRIGINLGDILIDGGDIAGEGVNVAARLESMAQPGGIMISQAVREQVRQLVGVSLDHAGTHKVKNISRPIRVYTVRMDPARRRSLAKLWWRRLRLPALALLAGVLTAGSLLLAQRQWTGERPPASIVVLPFAAHVNAEALAEPTTNEVTAALTRALGASVIARATAARYGGGKHDVKDIGAALRVRYAMDGTVAVQGDRLRLAAQLISAETGAQLWSGSIEAAREGSVVPDELIGRLTDRLVGELRAAELRRPRQGPPRAYELVLQARADLPHTETNEQLLAVRELYERALKLEPRSVAALSGLAYVLSIESGRTDDAEQSRQLLKRADTVSLEAIAADSGYAEAWGARAQVLRDRGQPEAAAEAAARALSLAPHSNEAQAQVGLTLLDLGRAEEAIAALDRAIRLNPTADVVGVHLFYRCKALLYLGRYAEALDACTRALAFTPDWPDYMLLAAIHAQLGQMDRATAARTELLRREPKFTIAWLTSDANGGPRTTHAARDKHLVAGLRKAGVPE